MVGERGYSVQGCTPVSSTNPCVDPQNDNVPPAAPHPGAHASWLTAARRRLASLAPIHRTPPTTFFTPRMDMSGTPLREGRFGDLGRSWCRFKTSLFTDACYFDSFDDYLLLPLFPLWPFVCIYPAAIRWYRPYLPNLLRFSQE